MNKIIIFFLFIIFCCACTQKPKDPVTHQPDKKKESLININKYLLGKDADVINGFIKRHNWEMEMTQTGLRYMIYSKGAGKKVSEGDSVFLKYTLSLLDGTVCYTSDKDGIKSFKVGKGTVENGLDEGVRFMHLGDKARFIMLPHLAFGLVGDENKIPARTTILYDIELIKITP